jgi:exopolyphosphatase/guanosine-5'-triphosphate,3'-diphosphate pyrophosphatase
LLPCNEEGQRKEVADLIREKADINIEIIDGKWKCNYYCFNGLTPLVKTDQTYLLSM